MHLPCVLAITFRNICKPANNVSGVWDSYLNNNWAIKGILESEKLAMRELLKLGHESIGIYHLILTTLPKYEIFYDNKFFLI